MASSSRALNAILPQIATAPYEAHQKARTFAARYVKSNQLDTAIDVLFQSARELLKTGQPGSGVDLAGFMLEVYETKGEKVTDESRGRVTQLIALTGSEGTWRKSLIDKAVAWSAKHGAYPGGDPDLHHYVGSLLVKEGAYDVAEHHLLAAGLRDSARLLAESFIRWMEAGGEAGNYALKGTLPYLLNGNILAARTFITTFVAQLPQSKLVSAPPLQAGDSVQLVQAKDGVVNFCQAAVLACQRANGDRNKVMRESWVRLCGTYQSRGGALAQPEVRKILNEIGGLYFSLPPPRSPGGNPMADMMSSLFGGGAPQAQPARRQLAPALPAAAITQELD
ncbi:hypothetical protein GGG16DRAFT_100636 [Schizophyllum commune]